MGGPKALFGGFGLRFQLWPFSSQFLPGLSKMGPFTRRP